MTLGRRKKQYRAEVYFGTWVDTSLLYKNPTETTSRAVFRADSRFTGAGWRGCQSAGRSQPQGPRPAPHYVLHHVRHLRHTTHSQGPRFKHHVCLVGSARTYHSSPPEAAASQDFCAQVWNLFDHSCAARGVWLHPGRVPVTGVGGDPWGALSASLTHRRFLHRPSPPFGCSGYLAHA